MKVKDYLKARQCKKDIQGSIFSSLSDTEKEYALAHFLVVVKGKCQTHNYIILTETTKKAMDVLLEARESCGVLATNQYFFALPGHETSYIHSSPVLSFFTELTGVTDMATRNIRKSVQFIIKTKNDKIYTSGVNALIF
jgi:hypothetical protein